MLRSGSVEEPVSQHKSLHPPNLEFIPIMWRGCRLARAPLGVAKPCPHHHMFGSTAVTLPERTTGNPNSCYVWWVLLLFEDTTVITALTSQMPLPRDQGGVCASCFPAQGFAIAGEAITWEDQVGSLGWLGGPPPDSLSSRCGCRRVINKSITSPR